MIKVLILLFLLRVCLNSCYTLCDTCTDKGLKCLTCKDFATHSSLGQCTCIDGYTFVMSNNCVPTSIFVGVIVGGILGFLLMCIICVHCFKNKKKKVLPEIKVVQNLQNPQAISEPQIKINKINKGLKKAVVKHQQKKNLNELKVRSTHTSFASSRVESKSIDSSMTMDNSLKIDESVSPLPKIPYNCILCDQPNTNYITNCGHQFHLDCLKSWQLENQKCPICEHELENLK